jgi:hypothetical protein
VSRFTPPRIFILQGRICAAADCLDPGALPAAAFTINSTAATDALMARLDRLDAGAQTALAQLQAGERFNWERAEGEAMKGPKDEFASPDRLTAIGTAITIRKEHHRTLLRYRCVPGCRSTSS